MAETSHPCPVSRISTRTKIAVGIGLAVVALVVVALTGSSPQPQVSIGVVSSTSNSITLSITNSGPRTMCHPWFSFHAHVGSLRLRSFRLAAGSSTQLLASVSSPRPDRINVTCYPENLTDDFLRKIGCKVTNTYFIVSVDLPPKP